MDFALAIRGDLQRIMAGEAALARQAVAAATKAQMSETQAELRAEASDALGRAVGNTWRAKYREYYGHPVGFVYTRAPNIILAFAADTVIVPKKGRFLAIPTNFNRAAGRKVGPARVSPADMVKSHLSFTRPRKDGKPGLVWFLAVTRAQTRSKVKQVVKDIAYAGGLVRVGGGRRRPTEAIIEARAVPMFILVPQVRLKQRLDLEAVVSRARSGLPEKLSRAFALLDQGYRP